MIAVTDETRPDGAQQETLPASESYSELLSAADMGQAMVIPGSRDLEQLGRSLGQIAESLRGYGAGLARAGGGLVLNGVAAGSDGVSLGTWKELLARNVGRSCLVSFLIGTQETVTAEGTLVEVGTDYLVLRQSARGSYITADYYSVRFVEFRDAD